MESPNNSWVLPDNYSTPVLPQPIRAGVSSEVLLVITYLLLDLIIFILQQPCFAGVVSKHKPLDENASTKDIVKAFNGLQGDYLNRCLRENIDFANQADINDGEFNKTNATRVSPQIYIDLYLISLW